MNAKETIKYLYEHGHIIRHGHFKDIMTELDKPATEHPDVQKLIATMVVLQAKYDRIHASHAKLVEYAVHDIRCRQHNYGSNNKKYDCVCGLEQALVEAAEEVGK